MEYEVSWSVEVGDAVSAEDAAGQAWAIMDDARHGGPATILVVRTLDGLPVAVLDMGFDPPAIVHDDRATFDPAE